MEWQIDFEDEKDLKQSRREKRIIPIQKSTNRDHTDSKKVALWFELL